MDKDTMEGMSPGNWGRVGPAPAHAEKGNYNNMFDDNGHFIGWVNPKAGKFFGPEAFPALEAAAAAGGGEATPARMPMAAADRALQAKAIGRAAPPLIDEIQRLRGKVGNMEDYWEKAKLSLTPGGTPFADPDLAGLTSLLVTFAALQPAAHGVKGLRAIEAFEGSIGGIPKNPDALIASIRKTVQGTSALIPPARGGGATTPATPPVGGGGKINFRPSTRQPGT